MKRGQGSHLISYTSKCYPTADLSDLPHRPPLKWLLYAIFCDVAKRSRRKTGEGAKTELYLLLRHSVRAHWGLLSPMGNFYCSIQRSLWMFNGSSLKSMNSALTGVIHLLSNSVQTGTYLFMTPLCHFFYILLWFVSEDIPRRFARYKFCTSSSY